MIFLLVLFLSAVVAALVGLWADSHEEKNRAIFKDDDLAFGVTVLLGFGCLVGVGIVGYHVNHFGHPVWRAIGYVVSTAAVFAVVFGFTLGQLDKKRKAKNERGKKLAMNY